MAYRSQHLEQIMENQTRFNLSAAVENWRQELAAQSNLTAEVRRELETHLLDSVAQFQQRGLNEDESFWLARRRVGPPQPLGEEFAKANPFAVVRERVLWMAVALLAVTLWNGSANMLCQQLPVDQWFSPTASFCLEIMLHTLPFFALVIYSLSGPNQIFSRLALLFQSRSRFLMAAIGWLALNDSGWFFAEQKHHHLYGFGVSVWINLAWHSIWPVALAALIVWVIPRQNQKQIRV